MKRSWLLFLQSYLYNRFRTPQGSTPYAFLVHAAKGSTDANSATTPAIDTTGASFIIVAIGNVAGISGAPTDNKGNSYQLAAVGATNNGNGQAAIWYAANPTVGAGHTVTTSVNGSAPSIAMAAFSGPKLAAPLDQTNHNATSTAQLTIQPGAVTPTQTNELIITALTMNGTATIDPFYTITDQINIAGGQHFGVALAYKIRITITTENPTWTMNTESQLATAIATFKDS